MKKFPTPQTRSGSPSHPPATLSPAARTWWQQLCHEYDIVDAAGLLILGTALEAYDRMKDAQQALAKAGLTITDRFGAIKPHPAVVVERDARAGMLAALRDLHLDIEPLQARPGRPPKG